MASTELWTYNVRSRPGVDLMNLDLTGFKVEASDGDIGKVDESTHEAGGSYVVVDTGPWIFGKKVMLPAGVIRDIDLDTEAILVDLTKEEIKNAPEFDQDRYLSEDYRSELGNYYGGRRSTSSSERI